jgi:enterochelin esterase-like enzyme
LFFIGSTLLLTACQRPVPVQDGAPDQSTRTLPAAEMTTPTPFAPDEPTATLTPAATPTNTPPPCETMGGQVIEYAVEHDDLIDPLVFRVYEPPCYGKANYGDFPVLYLLHGQTYTDAQWQRLGIAETADQLIADGLIRPYLIVMPLEHDTFADIYKSEFSQSMLEILIPWIDILYDTCADRHCRAIGGLSRGGAWAVHLGFSNWQLFGSIGAHSTPPFNGDLYRLTGWVEAIPPEQLPRVYLDIGRSDIFRPYAAELDATLTALQVPHEWVIPDGEHNEDYWQANLKSYLQWYGLGW